MAKKGGKKDEHQMLFDLQSGKRRVVVKVVYAVLAVLMGLSLLLIAGPLPFGDIFGSEDATEVAREQNEERIERIEAKVAKDPANPVLLLNLTTAHLTAGDNFVEQVGPEQFALTPESRQEYEQAASTWDEYLEATDKPSIGTAQRMSNTFLQLAETSTNLDDSKRNIAAAAEAQQIVAERSPSIGSLGTLALYTNFTFDYAAAERFNDEAKKFATSKFEREQLDNQFEETQKRAKQFEKEVKREEGLEKALNESQKQEGGGGGGSLPQNPFGLGGATLSE